MTAQARRRLGIRPPRHIPMPRDILTPRGEALVGGALLVAVLVALWFGLPAVAP